MPVTDRDLAVARRLTAYLTRLLDRLGERVGDRVAERLEGTLDVLTDRDLMRDLDRADLEPDERAVPLEDVLNRRRSG
jgi:hypothetical protein